MPYAVLYSRVSTSDKGQNPEVQLVELRRFCSARQWNVVNEIVDHGYSGASDRRPGLAQLMSLVRNRQVDLVLVAKMDRLFRSLKHMVTTLDEFQSLGVQFISVGDQIDLTTASGRLMLHIIAAFAEFERALIRERTVAGLLFARSQGKTLGRPKKRDDKAIVALRRQGLSQSAICKLLKVSKGAVWRAIQAAPKTPPNGDSKKPTKSKAPHG
jgi:DNA invertase Pin-like site-specific DNA recombinase